jgi:hypothetical protein
MEQPCAHGLSLSIVDALQEQRRNSGLLDRVHLGIMYRSDIGVDRLHSKRLAGDIRESRPLR